ncbi:hypothetical protein E3T61_19965 [Cryobacterium lactosi]|uniref:Uncharacterized protein n=1 Tax=Cryobacterium lactosi TaxID=1259202 RepID=A0A4R9BH52_9MICO|nr:hypothetical protein [Cryobacterium lactosi]TFD84045.1 hypothetical protein E3T61_19965 [Cryobacterium lactosi]
MPANESRTTPNELARELGHTDGGRTIRTWLRLHHPRPDTDKYQRWALTSAEANDVLEKFQR